MSNKSIVITKKDYALSILAGLLVGFLFLPILHSAKPDLYEHYALYIFIFFIFATPIGLTIAYWMGKRFPIFWQLGKFTLSGGLSFCVDLGVLSLLSFVFEQYFSINPNDPIFESLTFLTFYSIYKSLSFIVANINSYYWNKYWTFHEEGQKSAQFLQFFVVSLIGFLVNVFFASLIFKFVSSLSALTLNQWGLIGAVVGAIAGLAWNFLGYKFVVFKK